MIRNYSKIALRNLRKNKTISFINLFGLTVGLTSCLLIVAYIINEISYDKQHPYADRTYRISRSFHNDEGVESLHLGAVAPPFGPLLQSEFPEIEKMTRMLSAGNTAFAYEDKRFYENNVFFADENFADVFDVAVVKGNPRKALDEPFSIMLTEEVATKYFGKEDPVNKLVKLDNNIPCKVAGVFKSFPSNMHLHPDVLISFNTLKDSAIYGAEALRTNWGNNSFFTYIVLPEKYDHKNLEARFPAFIDKYYHFPDEPPGFVGSKTTHLYLWPLTDIHLRSHLDDEVEENGDIKRVYIFSIVAFFILLIACINYMNLSTARSVLRAKEIGIRKAIGAEKREIVLQFLSESVLLSYVAMVLAIAITAALLPWLNNFSGTGLQLASLFRWDVLVPVVVAPLFIGVLSGVYPALFMSSFEPVRVLKGLFKVGGNLSLRKALVVIQFAVSIVLIICTAIVFKQLRYMQEASLGFDKDQIVTMFNTAAFGNHFESFRQELLQQPGIKEVARSSRIPSGRLLDASGIAIPAGDSMRGLQLDIKYLSVDYQFVPTYNFQVVAGRNFSSAFATDSSNFVINEAAASAIGYRSPKQAIDQRIQYGGREGKIIGVVKDFHFESMHQTIPALLMAVDPNNYGRVSVKLAGSDVTTALSTVELTWKKFLPEVPFDYNFLDESFSRLYDSEQRQKTIFTAFACIAIFIACLGLFGLSAFTISQRVKEIGIRKVLGAEVSAIVGLLSIDFLKLVGIAALIAFPVAWYAMYSWLNDFAYRIGIPWWTFLLAGVLACAIAFITISYQAIKAATANPVKSLRTE